MLSDCFADDVRSVVPFTDLDRTCTDRGVDVSEGKI